MISWIETRDGKNCWYYQSWQVLALLFCWNSLRLFPFCLNGKIWKAVDNVTLKKFYFFFNLRFLWIIPVFSASDSTAKAQGQSPYFPRFLPRHLRSFLSAQSSGPLLSPLPILTFSSCTIWSFTDSFWNTWAFGSTFVFQFCPLCRGFHFCFESKFKKLFLRDFWSSQYHRTYSTELSGFIFTVLWKLRAMPCPNEPFFQKFHLIILYFMSQLATIICHLLFFKI